jgi:hypothetical protein
MANKNTWDYQGFYEDVNNRLNQQLFQIRPDCLSAGELEK